MAKTLKAALEAARDFGSRAQGHSRHDGERAQARITTMRQQLKNLGRLFRGQPMLELILPKFLEPIASEYTKPVDGI